MASPQRPSPSSGAVSQSASIVQLVVSGRPAEHLADVLPTVQKSSKTSAVIFILPFAQGFVSGSEVLCVGSNTFTLTPTAVASQSPLNTTESRLSVVLPSTK